jgi:hypothetical protein
MFIVAAMAALASTIAAAWGSAYVTSLPVGSEIWVDGVYAGHAPVFVDLLVPGPHSITVSRAGWSPKRASFSVAAGQIITVSVALDRPSGPAKLSTLGHERGALAIRGVPPGAVVTVDGIRIPAASAPPKPIAAGRHLVVVKPKNGNQIVHLVTVYPGTVTVAMFSNTQSVAVDAVAQEDVLAPLDKYVPPQNYSTAGNEVVIHYRGVEVECTIGSRTYALNGRSAMLAVPPTLVHGKVYLPLSLLQKITSPKQPR